MKLYATVTSERASKGQGGNHLDIDIFTTGPDKATHHVKVREDKQTGNILVDFCATYFGKTRVIARECIYIGTETKGERQKGEKCPHDLAKYCEICSTQ